MKDFFGLFWPVDVAEVQAKIGLSTCHHASVDRALFLYKILSTHLPSRQASARRHEGKKN